MGGGGGGGGGGGDGVITPTFDFDGNNLQEKVSNIEVVSGK